MSRSRSASFPTLMTHCALTAALLLTVLATSGCTFVLEVTPETPTVATAPASAPAAQASADLSPATAEEAEDGADALLKIELDAGDALAGLIAVE